MNDKGKIILGLGIGYAAYMGWKYIYAPIQAVDPSGASSFQMDLAAVLINTQLDTTYGTHDPSKIPNYMQVVLGLGQALGSKFAA